MKITILEPTQHDDKHYAAGDKADLPQDACDALIACGAAEPSGRAAQAKADKPDQEAA
jgi:hypothetical protein